MPGTGDRFDLVIFAASGLKVASGLLARAAIKLRQAGERDLANRVLQVSKSIQAIEIDLASKELNL